MSELLFILINWGIILNFILFRYILVGGEGGKFKDMMLSLQDECTGAKPDYKDEE